MPHRTGLLLSIVVLALACASTTSEGVPPDAGTGDAGASDSAVRADGGSSSGTASSSGASGGSGGGSSGGSGSSSGTARSSSGTSSGATSGGDAGSDGGAAGDCSSLPLCDGFESDAPDAAPNAALWSVVMGCNPNMPNTPVDGGGLLVSVDGAPAHAHSGAHSLRVVGGDSCGYYAVNTSAFSKLTGPTFYARFYARFSGPPTQNHNGFLSMATGATDHLRLGFQSNVIDWNELPSDSTLPDLDPQGTALSATTNANNWDCIEFSVDAPTGNIQFWLNDTSVQGLSFVASQTPVQGVNDQWARGGPKVPVAFTNFGLGWLGLNNQYTAWFDDVALSNARIGCH